MFYFERRRILWLPYGRSGCKEIIVYPFLVMSIAAVRLKTVTFVGKWMLNGSAVKRRVNKNRRGEMKRVNHV